MNFSNMLKKLACLFLVVCLFSCTGEEDSKDRKPSNITSTKQKASNTFVIKDEPLDNFSSNKIENLDSKYGFKNIHLGTRLEDFNFGENWSIYEYKNKLIVAKKDVGDIKISDVKLTSITLFFYQKNLFEIQVIADPGRLYEGNIWEPLIYLFGQPNEHQFGEVVPKFTYINSLRNFSSETYKPTVYKYINNNVHKRILKKEEKVKVKNNNKPKDSLGDAFTTGDFDRNDSKSLGDAFKGVDQNFKGPSQAFTTGIPNAGPNAKGNFGKSSSQGNLTPEEQYKAGLEKNTNDFKQNKSMAIWSTSKTQLVYIDGFSYGEFRISIAATEKIWKAIEKLAIKGKNDRKQDSLRKQIQKF